MRMSLLTRRTQLLLDEGRYAKLERRAAATGRSIAALIREAIDEKLGHDDDAARRLRAAHDLLAAPAPDYDREPDWEQVKEPMRDRQPPPG